MSEDSARRETHSRYCAFGPYVIDVVRGVLWRKGATLHLRPKDVEILITLIERRDRVVEKNEIFNCVWPGVIVEENNIARRISELRRVLGEDAGQRSFVATFPGRGYRFVAEVTELSDLPWSRATEPIATDDQRRSAETDSDAARPPGAFRVAWKRSLGFGLLGTVGAVALFAIAATYAPATVAAPLTTRQFTFGTQLQQQAAWSQDGQLLAYASVDDGNSNIWVQKAADATPVRITTSSAHDWHPTWSPDGQWLAYRSDRSGGGIWIVRSDGTNERLLVPDGIAPQWSPDGKWILFAAGDGRSLTAWPYVVSASGGTATPVLESALAGSANKYAAWHPDGRLSVWFRDDKGTWKFITAPVGNGPIVESTVSINVQRGLVNAGIRLEGLDYPFSRLERFAWAPSGRHLYFEVLNEGVRGIWKIAVDERTLAWTQGPDPVTAGIGNHAQIALSPRGDKMAFTAQTARTRVWAIPLDRSGRQSGPGAPLTPGRDTEVYTRTTADGQLLVYRSVQGSRNEFKFRDLASGADDRTLISGIDRNGLQLSPDGARVVYTRFGERGPNYVKHSKVVTLPVSGGDERVVFDSPRLQFAPSDWSLDGQRLLGRCVAEDTGVVSICTLPAQPGYTSDNAIRLVTSARTRTSNLRAAVFSPDQRWIAFTESDTRSTAGAMIHVISSGGGAWITIAKGDFLADRARWSQDGRTVYFLSNRSGSLNVWGQSFDREIGQPIGQPFSVTSFSDPQLSIPHSSETGVSITNTHLLVPLAELTSNIWVLSGLAP